MQIVYHAAGMAIAGSLIWCLMRLFGKPIKAPPHLMVDQFRSNGRAVKQGEGK